jgi:hypothetical protein
MQRARQNSNELDEDRELKQWLRETIRRLKRSAPSVDDPEDPFADPAVRQRVAQLIARSY